ncbi:hypothetical protein [Marimonas arenosa]|uniref:Uncharacterized protein n=1 Tax=Marimonas arenosa TaxID=1795305 RepID=A0AAE3WI22_9RHOB|nr:hypothetical protein [Marimonas arenosa]MDQ2091948.1 hypothetical protein [Marimonas arenosa]
MPLLALAYPVLHSSGGWIAYYGTGYIAGTLSSTWTGALILGNATFFSSLGLVSAAGLAAASGMLSGLATGMAAGLGIALTKIGLGSAAAWLGIAPVPTFLGLTVIGWAAAGGAMLGGGLLLFLTRRFMRKLNEERKKGGLDSITPRQILREVREYETNAMLKILSALAKENASIKVSENDLSASFSGTVFSLDRLRYVVNSDGSEEIVFLTKTGRRRRVFLVRPSGSDDPEMQPV